ncbi:MAG: amino acid adenylation domain-containing protein, partial [bacterium]|nr:amino acid adenylation domain-containing protein [bacterium]
GFEEKPELSIKRKKETALHRNNTGTKNIHCKTRFLTLEREEPELFTRNHKITLSGLIYSAWGLLLQRYNNRQDIIFGTTVSGRSIDIKGIEDIVGLFINTIPLRVNTGTPPDGTRRERVEDFLTRLNNDLLERESFENTSLVEIKEYSEVRFEGELFDTIVVIENYPLDKVLFEKNHNLPSSLSVESFSMVEMTHYDLTVAVTLFDDIEVKFTYNEALLDEALIINMASHFQTLLGNIIANPAKELNELDILTAEEKKKIIYDFNDTLEDFPREKTLHGLFQDRVEQTPDRTALTGGNSNHYLTYGHLNNRAGQLAHRLKEEGVQTDTIVGIMMNRSLEMIIGIMGILKSGGAYLPIDPNYPKQRIDFMLGDSGTKIIVNNGLIVKRLTGSSESTNQPTNQQTNKSRNLAYVIYTSGSTGKPKGVLVQHRAVFNLLDGLIKKYPFGENDVYLFKTSYIFDVSVSEIFGWYMGGGRLALLDQHGEKDPVKIIRTIETHRVSHINFVPAMFSVFLETLEQKNINLGRIFSLSYIFLAGEALPPATVQRFFALGTPIQLENIYGPTESTVYTSAYSFPGWADGSVVPIGKPLQNIAIYILDNNRRLQPPGIPGELCIGGEGLALGYLNRPELTMEKFEVRSAKCELNSTLYHTGDFARWLPDGNVEFLGRIDHQVKIRGYRVELGEIESHLLSHKKIKDAVVSAVSGADGEKYLCAYVVPMDGDTFSNEKLDVPGLRDELSLVLPDYMVPAYNMQLEHIPLTAGGKVDKDRLPQPGLQFVETEYTPPVDSLEETLVSLWADVLNIEKNSIGTGSSFFRLGGHSLKAVRLISGIQKALNVDVPLDKLFQSPTINDLSAFIKEARKSNYQTIEAVEEKEYYPLSSAQKRLFVIYHLSPSSTAYNLPETLHLKGQLNRASFEAAIKALIRRHESLRTSFEIIDGEPAQKVHDHVEFELEFLGRGERTTECSPSPGTDFIRPFDLSLAPLLRLRLMEMAENHHLLFFDMHHIISDGVSLEIFTREFMALVGDRELPSPRLQYKDFSHWQNHRLSTTELKQQEIFWLNQFRDESPRLELPCDFPRPPVQSHAGDSLNFTLETDQFHRLEQVALETGTTLFMVLLALFNLLLSKLSGQEDIVIGTATAGRRHHDLDHIIGIFINTLPLRNYPSSGKSFLSFLGEVRNNFFQALENQDFQYEELVEKVVDTRDLSRSGLFDVMLMVQNMDQEPIEIPGLKLLPPETHRITSTSTSKFDIIFTAMETGDQLNFTVTYRTALFKRQRIEQFTGYFKRIASRVLENTRRTIGDTDILSKEERNRLLYDFNATAAQYPRTKTIDRLFEEQATRTPHRLAAVGIA